MTHKGTQTLETERLILRRFTAEDAEAMFRNWASNPEVTKYLTWPAHSDVGVTSMIIDSWISQYPKDNFYNWAIELKEIGEPIGGISVVGGNDDLMETEIGYCIGEAWWHRGITSEALKAVMDFMFDEVGMNRVEARHDTRNPNSGKVMRKCGMQYEGTLRSAARNIQGICDISCYAMLKSDR